MKKETLSETQVDCSVSVVIFAFLFSSCARISCLKQKKKKKKKKKNKKKQNKTKQNKTKNKHANCVGG